MIHNYTVQKSIQIFISALKGHNIRKVVVSPGTTNVMFVASIQQDDWFEVYSAADERSASYIACGLSAESGEPVVLTCTGATASRNYLPGLTEAYYRKLPVLAVTSLLSDAIPGQLIPQVIDRSVVAKDVVKMSVTISEIRGGNDEWKCMLLANQALIELRRNGGGPVHVNLVANYIHDYSAKTLPDINIIQLVTKFDKFPELPQNKKIGIFIGAHRRWTEEETATIEKFCELYNATVFTDHTGNYKGKHHVEYTLVSAQELIDKKNITVDLMIDLGEITGDYYTIPVNEVWRVSEGGAVQDRYKKLTKVFDMPEIEFFKTYVNAAKDQTVCNNDYYESCKKRYDDIYNKIPELPFSNVWVAKKLAKELPRNSVIHLGILNSLRAWNFFEIPDDVYANSNVGGFGIDGGLSTLVGASLANKEKLYFCVIGDLAFFYDMNSLGNRHVSNNLRIMLVNNGRGTEFRNYFHQGSAFGDDADKYIAAGGHYGNKSTTLIKHYAQDLGFEYICASNKEEFESVYSKFINPEIGDKPVLFEVFTESSSESEAIRLVRNVVHEIEVKQPSAAKQAVKNMLGEDNVDKIKSFLKR